MLYHAVKILTDYGSNLVIRRWSSSWIVRDTAEAVVFFILRQPKFERIANPVGQSSHFVTFLANQTAKSLLANAEEEITFVCFKHQQSPSLVGTRNQAKKDLLNVNVWVHNSKVGTVATANRWADVITFVGVTRLRVGQSGVRIPEGEKKIYLLEEFRPALGPTQAPTQWIPT